MAGPIVLPFEIEGIRYSVCGPADIQGMTRVIATSFARRDPPAIALGLTLEDFGPYLAVVCATAGTDGLSIIARDAASGSMAGALLTEDAGAPAEVDLGAISPRFGPIYELFEELEGRIGEAGPIEPGTTLHVFMLAVDERFAGRGIAQQLVQACLANGVALGYRAAVTEATNTVSQHIFAKLGFTTRAQASYADYRRDGVAVFASIADQGGIMSMTRALDG